MRSALCSVVLAVGFAAVASACAGCTDAGCSEGVTVDVPDVRARPGESLVTVTVCVEGRCADQRADSLRQLAVNVPVPDADVVDVSVTVQRADGRVVAEASGTGRVEIVHPNGERCDPHCRQVTLSLRGGRLS
jgi:hypothetical protein